MATEVRGRVSTRGASERVPEFRFYAVADGIVQLLFSSQRGLGPPLLRPGDQFLLLPFEV